MTNGPRPTTVGAPPIVDNLDGQLHVHWPSGREETFIMRTALFEAMIADINGGKRLAAALDEVRRIIGSLA